jgi:NADPH2:quinone reductase
MKSLLSEIGRQWISSTHCPVPLREKVWERPGSDLKPKSRDVVACRTVAFEDLLGQFDDLIEGRLTGRTVINIWDSPISPAARGCTA